MNIYNDFQLLSNEQYEELNNYYTTSTSPLKTEKLIAIKLQFCINSFTSLQNNFNNKIKVEILKLVKQLSDFKDSFKVLFPSIVFTNQNISTNIFTVLSETINITTLTSQLSNSTNKIYYKKVLSKLIQNTLNSLSNFMILLSTQDIKFFKYI